MEIVFHIGAHCTDDGQIHACLAKNRAMLGEERIIVPNPGRFRPVLRETLSVLNGAPANAEIQEIMLDSILTEDRPERIILSNDAFLCGIQKVFGGTKLYPEAADKVAKMANLFPDSPVEFCLATRNPATFLPACFSRSEAKDFAAYLAATNPLALRWSTVIEAIRQAVPNATIKVWSNEDTPFIWHELIREIADCRDGKRLIGLDDFIRSIMLPEGVDRMSAYLETRPPANETQRRRILSAFLDKFEKEDDTPDVAAPVWTDGYVSRLTEIYEEDLFLIERIPGVQFIAP